MTGSGRKLLQDVLALPEDKRREHASEIVAGVDGPRDADWEWIDVRTRTLKRLGRP